MIVKYEKKYREALENLLKDYSMNWGEDASLTVLALEDENIVGVGSLFQNKMHPHRDYLNLFVHPEWRRKGIGKSLLKELVSLSKLKKFQVMLSSKNKEAVSFLKKNGFQMARKSYTPVLESDNFLSDFSQNYFTLNQVDTTEHENIIQLQMENYQTFHQEINPLNDAITLKQWGEIVFDDLDKEHSFVWIDKGKVEAYLLCYEGEDTETIEIAYVGGRDLLKVETYLPFYLSVVRQLMEKFQKVEIEADDVDAFAYGLLSPFTYDKSDSWDTYVYG